MGTPRRFTLRARLLLGFAAIGALVAALWLMGDAIIRDASTRIEGSLNAQVRPLARLNRLQAQVNSIRVLEVEMPRLADLFAVQDQIARLTWERTTFDRDLAIFIAEARQAHPAEAASLDENWRRYQGDLQRVIAHADRMELDAVQRIATFESAPRFKALSRTVKTLGESTEAGARAAFTQAIEEHDRQRTLFVITSAAGLALLAAWIALFARSVTGRVSSLRDAAARVADGRGEDRIEVAGNDELTDLGAAFNTMQERVRSREQALRASHDELERRVEERTSELNTANAKLHYQAQYDSLTDLPNRILAMDRLGQAIHAAQRGHNHVVLMFMDLDDFKKVNDTLGHQAGDQLLVQAARRLRRAVRADDTVARLGGDEFLVVLGGVATREDAGMVAEAIVRQFAPSFEIGGSEVVVSASVGVAVYPADGEDADTLLRSADLAMYDAKEAGRNTYRFFDPEAHGGSMSRLTIERRLRIALQRDELRLYYQPLVATATRELLGVEALLRWESPESGLLGPEAFISIAEDSGLIVEIGEWVLQTACAQARAWRDQGHGSVRVAVNVSPRQFRGDRLVTTVRECLARQELEAAGLQLEVTEGVLVRNQPEVLRTLHALSELGVRLAMDDFGTGYSSLSYLKRFPFDALKIDREFVRDVATDPDDRALVTAAIRMGKGLGLTVTAEGVETEEQLEFLASQDCDLAQGYLFSKPMPPRELEARWLARELVHERSALH